MLIGNKVCPDDLAQVQADFEARRAGANAKAGETWPWPVKAHKFVPWPEHTACAWCCGALSNPKWHPKELQK